MIDNALAYHKYRDRLPREVVRCIRQTICTYNNCVVLDLGCGTGFLSTQIDDIAKILALDNNFPSIQVGRSHSTGRTRIIWINAEANAIPIRKNTCDVIILANSLHWLIQSDHSFSWLSCLSPGGSVLAISRSSILTIGGSWKQSVRELATRLLGQDWSSERIMHEYRVGRHETLVDQSDLRLSEDFNLSTVRCLNLEGAVGLVKSSVVFRDLEQAIGCSRAVSELRKAIASSECGDRYLDHVRYRFTKFIKVMSMSSP